MRRLALLAALWSFVLPAALASADSGRASPKPVTLSVRATANIFGAGHVHPPAGSGGIGSLPPVYTLPSGTGRTLTFSSVTGKVQCCKTGDKVFNGPGGRSDGQTDLTGVGGISGVKARRAMFLVGVFLGPDAPSDTPSTHTSTRSPVLGQVFAVGTGKSGGKPIVFAVPDGATRLFLGIADGFSFHGAPSYYGDNAGKFVATFTVGR
jgi:hypothetical protein